MEGGLCKRCEKVFIRTGADQKFCCKACRLAYYKEHPMESPTLIKDSYARAEQELLDKAKEKEKRRKRKPKLSVVDVAVLARQAGMTYGQYVATHNL